MTERVTGTVAAESERNATTPDGHNCGSAREPVHSVKLIPLSRNQCSTSSNWLSRASPPHMDQKPIKLSPRSSSIASG